jgi:hypothetical protein
MPKHDENLGDISEKNTVIAVVSAHPIKETARKKHE